jgi:hypothetical protein
MLHRTIATFAMIGLLGAIVNPTAKAAQKDSGSPSGAPSGIHDTSAKGSDSVKGSGSASKIQGNKGSKGASGKGVKPVGATITLSPGHLKPVGATGIGKPVGPTTGGPVSTPVAAGHKCTPSQCEALRSACLKKITINDCEPPNDCQRQQDACNSISCEGAC